MNSWKKFLVCCGRKLCWPILAVFVFIPAASRAGSDADQIEILIAPFLAPQVLLTRYAPLRAYLERTLERPVLIVTAPDYRTFNERMLRGETALSIAVANSAQLAIEDKGYVPYLRPEIYTRPTLVVAKESVIERVMDLKGSVVATTDPMGVIAMQGGELLRNAGLTPGLDLTLRNLVNHGAAINHVISHDADAAIVSDRALSQMPAAQRQGVRVVADWKDLATPGVVYLARADVPTEQLTRIQKAIIEFVSTTDEGRAMMRATGYGTLVPTDANELKFLAPYAAQLRTLLATTDAESR